MSSFRDIRCRELKWEFILFADLMPFKKQGLSQTVRYIKPDLVIFCFTKHNKRIDFNRTGNNSDFHIYLNCFYKIA